MRRATRYRSSLSPACAQRVIESLECSYPGILSPAMKELLGSCCGLAGTATAPIVVHGTVSAPIAAGLEQSVPVHPGARTRRLSAAAVT
jgi:hypothetical protein